MRDFLRTFLRRTFGKPVAHALNEGPENKVERIAPKTAETVKELRLTESQLVSFDETLFERARTQWQFGDWRSLAQLNCDDLQHHPDRAKLALLAAAGRLQINQIEEARQYIRLACDWGVNKTLLSHILAAGVHNSLGRCAAISGEHQRAFNHFYNSIATVFPCGETQLFTQARINMQYEQIDLSTIDTKSLNKSPSAPLSMLIPRE